MGSPKKLKRKPARNSSPDRNENPFLALEMALEKDCNAERDRNVNVIINGDAPEKSHFRTVIDAIYFRNLPMKLYGQGADGHN